MRLEAALVQRPRAVADPPPAGEMAAHRRVGLEALHLLERRQPGVAVVETDDEAVRHQVGAEMVQERPAIGLPVERPADRVLDQPGAVVVGRDLPQFLDADRVGLRLGAFAQGEAGDRLLAERAAAALGEHGVGGAQFHAALVAAGGGAVLADAHVAGGDADHFPVLHQQFGGGEAGVDFHPQRLRLLAQPAHHVAERDDVVARVVHLRRGGQAEGPCRGQEQEPVFPRGREQRRALSPASRGTTRPARAARPPRPTGYARPPRRPFPPRRPTPRARAASGGWRRRGRRGRRPRSGRRTPWIPGGERVGHRLDSSIWGAGQPMRAAARCQTVPGASRGRAGVAPPRRNAETAAPACLCGFGRPPCLIA